MKQIFYQPEQDRARRENFVKRIHQSLFYGKYVFFNVYIGGIGPLFFNYQIQESPMEESKLNKIFLSRKEEIPLKLLF